MADKKANQGTTITPEARVANNIVRVSNEDGTAGNGLKIPLTDFSLRDIQTTRNTCIALLASSGSAITTGQGYVFDGAGGAIPSGLSLIRIKGIDLTLGAKGFSPNAEAYVTALGIYVPCSYDVSTGIAQFDYLLWAGRVGQAGTDAPTIFSTAYNISGEDPTFSYTATGQYEIVFTGDQLVSAESVFPFCNVYDGKGSGFAVIEGQDSNSAFIYCIRSGANVDDRLDNTYIEVRLVYTLTP